MFWDALLMLFTTYYTRIAKSIAKVDFMEENLWSFNMNFWIFFPFFLETDRYKQSLKFKVSKKT